MRMKRNRSFAMILALLLLVPIFWNHNTSIASAATPKFAKSKIELIGEGEVYQLVINDKVAKSTYKWTSSNKKIVKVSSKGLLTSVSGGTTTVKCKITYPTKKTKTLACSVTVTIPADEIRISNSVEVNGAHIIPLGSTFNFDASLLPVKSSDKTYWTIGGGDADCIRIDNANEGTVTAMKAGKVILVATALKKASAAEAKKSIVNDAVIIEVVGPTAAIHSAEIVGSNEIKVIFGSPVNKSTIIDSANKLLDSITVSLLKDVKNVLAGDPGTLTPSLSSDLMTLTITSKNRLEGIYGINFTSKILTTSGVAMEGYYKQMTYIDTAPPAILGVVIDDTGMIATINFTEAIDITNFNAINATELYSSGATGTSSTTTYSTLNNKLNYILSEDKKSLEINLSKIASTDYGKTYSITFTGIKDLSGIAPSSFTLTTVLRTDNTKKPQARPYMIVRTGYNTLTATFNRAMQTGGMLTITGGSQYFGVVDTTDNKKVNFTISNTDALITDNRVVSIGLYNSYNVIETDLSANTMTNFNVNFAVDKTSPVLINPEYDSETGILSLTFNEEIIITSEIGIFSTLLETTTDERKPGTNINYTQIASADKKVIKLKITNMTIPGNYTFSIDPVFATDNFKNPMMARTITISNKNGTSSELPGPYLIAQSSGNLSEIRLEFLQMIDIASAQTVNNYKIAGVTILSAYVTKNTADNGATVLLTVADNGIDVTTSRPVTITGVMGYKGSYTPITAFSQMVELKDNTKPRYVSATFDTTLRNNIKLNFSEQIKGTMTVKVTRLTSTVPIEVTSTITINGNSVVINLATPPFSGEVLRVDVLSSAITDASGNAATNIPTSVAVPAYY